MTMGESITDARLKNCKKIECQFTNEGEWHLICTVFNGYSLMSYSSTDVGVNYASASGKVTVQYDSTSGGMVLDKIVAYR